MRMLMGPILFAMDVSPINRITGIVLCLVLVPGMLVGILRPRWWSVPLSGLAALAWLFCGIIGQGIDC